LFLSTDIKCFNCHQLGHKSFQCNINPANNAGPISRDNNQQSQNRDFHHGDEDFPPIENIKATTDLITRPTIFKDNISMDANIEANKETPNNRPALNKSDTLSLKNTDVLEDHGQTPVTSAFNRQPFNINTPKTTLGSFSKRGQTESQLIEIATCLSATPSVTKGSTGCANQSKTAELFPEGPMDLAISDDNDDNFSICSQNLDSLQDSDSGPLTSTQLKKLLTNVKGKNNAVSYCQTFTNDNTGLINQLKCVIQNIPPYEKKSGGLKSRINRLINTLVEHIDLDF
jgi:hypothetical protein